MARRRISVERIKDVIRYGVTTGLSERAIGRALKVSHYGVVIMPARVRQARDCPRQGAGRECGTVDLSAHLRTVT